MTAATTTTMSTWASDPPEGRDVVNHEIVLLQVTTTENVP
jgi:hypothetical protein